MKGATNAAIHGVDVVARAALEATATDVLDADGILLGTPANLGYMSGALKHFFDTVYYPCLSDKTEPVSVLGAVSTGDHDRCWELGASLAALLMK